MPTQYPFIASNQSKDNQLGDYQSITIDGSLTYLVALRPLCLKKYDPSITMPAS